MKKKYRYDNGKRMLHTNTGYGYRPPVLGVPSTKNFVLLSKIELSLTKGSLSPKPKYNTNTGCSPEVKCASRDLMYVLRTAIRAQIPRLVAGFSMSLVFCKIKRREEGGVIVGVKHGK